MADCGSMATYHEGTGAELPPRLLGRSCEARKTARCGDVLLARAFGSRVRDRFRCGSRVVRGLQAREAQGPLTEFRTRTRRERWPDRYGAGAVASGHGDLGRHHLTTLGPDLPGPAHPRERPEQDPGGRPPRSVISERAAVGLRRGHGPRPPTPTGHGVARR